MQLWAKLCAASTILPIIIAWGVYQWLHIQPRVDWTPSSQTEFEACPKDSPVMMVFGATSMLGKYIVESFAADTKVCLVSFSRSKCEKCQVTLRGDLRDIRLVRRAIEFYKPDTILTSVKPPLLSIHYKTYIELNLLSMVQLIDAAKELNVRNFIYVSSIAAAGHYFDHHDSKESDPQPFYTDYEAPYDVSKRFAEDYLLHNHEAGKFNAIAIRVSGIIGGDGDPYDYYRYPILAGFEPSPPAVDSNFAGNIADALVVVYNKMHSKDVKKIAGTFYYYTGESMTETEKIRIVKEVTNKPLIIIPKWLLEIVVDIWNWARFDPLVYNFVDLLRMGLVPQTFDQSKFREAFPEFKEKIKMREALKLIYGN